MSGLNRLALLVGCAVIAACSQGTELARFHYIPNAKVADQKPRRPQCPASACIYVANETYGGSITVYPSNATGNVAPHRTISGLTYPVDVAVDQRDRTYVTVPNSSSGNEVAVYAAAANGDAPPLYTIAGPRTRLNGPTSLGFDSASRLHVLNIPCVRQCLDGRVTVYRTGAKGNASSIDTIQGRATKMALPGAMAVDPAGNIYVATYRLCGPAGCNGQNAIRMYAAGAHGDARPTWTISGSRTQLSPIGPSAVALDSSGNIYVIVLDLPSVKVYAAGAHGNVAPIRVISGSETGLNVPDGIFVDASGKIYITNGLSPESITVYAAGATGNVSPTQTITGTKTGLDNPNGIVVH